MVKIELKLGHVIDKLKEIPDNSIDCIVTSPPYYGLRKYKAPNAIWGGDSACEHEWGVSVPLETINKNRNGLGQNSVVRVRNQEWVEAKVIGSYCQKCGAWQGQLGLEPDYHLYLDHVLMVTAELKRVLKPTGILWWNMGDSYNGNKEGKTDKKVSDYIKNDQNGLVKTASSSMPLKSLMQLPTRFAIRMVDEQGWILRNIMIWHKRNGMPSSVRDRLTNSYEFIFFFTKQKKYFFNLDAVRVKSIWADKDKRSLQRRVVGKSGKITENQYATNAVGYNPLGKNPGDVLELTTQPFKGAHFAVFPPKLPEFCIKAGCPNEGVVLDPFAGSGTTMLVAKQLGRSAIGIEISPEYAKIIKQRLDWGSGLNIHWIDEVDR